jgi:hypothetical protein
MGRLTGVFPVELIRRERIDLDGFVAGDNIVSDVEFPAIPPGYKVTGIRTRVRGTEGRDAGNVLVADATTTLAARLENGATDVVLFAATALATLKALAGDVDSSAAVNTAIQAAGARLTVAVAGAGVVRLAGGYLDVEIRLSPA